MLKKTLEKYMLEPFERYFKLESSSGVVLLIATLIALLISNSPWADSYYNFWHQESGIQINESFKVNAPLIHWVNDGLMAIFFFHIGLEIKRELLVGHLSSFQKASLPILAALGGILLPVIIYILFNNNPQVDNGWGIPMATDIAFSLAILKLLGKKVPIGLKVFLTTFAIADDIGAVLVIALFYSSDIHWDLIILSLLILAMLLILSKFGLYSKYIFFPANCIIWFLFLESGIHPTLSGILVAFTIPIQRRSNFNDFFHQITHSIKELNKSRSANPQINIPLNIKQVNIVEKLEVLIKGIRSPLQNLERKLHVYVAFGILPLFALANAGVSFTSQCSNCFDLSLLIGASLLLGKCIGISLLSFLAVKLKIAVLPEGVNYGQIIGVSVLGGLGFTMAIFITNLAFFDIQYINAAKIGILIASVLAGIIGYLIIRFYIQPKRMAKQTITE